MEVGSVCNPHLSGRVDEIDPLVISDSALDGQLAAVIEDNGAAPAENDARGDIGEAFDLDDAGGGDLVSNEVQRTLLSNQDQGVVGAVHEGEVARNAGSAWGSIDGESPGDRLNHELAREGRDALAEQGCSHRRARVTAGNGQGYIVEGRRVCVQRDGRAVARAAQDDLLADNGLRRIDGRAPRLDDYRVAKRGLRLGPPVVGREPMAEGTWLPD